MDTDMDRNSDDAAQGGGELPSINPTAVSAPPSSSSYSTTGTSFSSVTLPPISTIYNFSAGGPSTTSIDSSGVSSTSSRPRNPIPSHMQRWYQHPPQPSDQASFNTRLTAADTAEIAARDQDDEQSGEDEDMGSDDGDDRNFVYENGRRYHANAQGRVLYPMPNDESEQERDDMKHKLTLWMMHERLFYAPVEGRLNEGGIVFDLGM